MKSVKWAFVIMLFLAACGQPPAYVDREVKFIDVPNKPELGAGEDTPKNNNATPIKPTNPKGENPDVEVIGGSDANPTKPSVTPVITAEVCQKQGLKISAPNLIFLVDNSGSNKTSRDSSVGTDCPQQSDSVCLGEPVRKLTVLSVANDLQKLDMETADAAATSLLSVISYSGSANTIMSQASTGALFSIPTLTGLMDFTKRPEGFTNYVSAFDRAKAIFTSSSANAAARQKVVINLSDGFPTNNPQDVFNSAKLMRETGIKMITVIYTKDADFASAAAKWEASTSFSQEERDWVIGRGRKSLISDISDEAFLVKNVEKLPDVVSSIVNKYALGCK